MLCRCSETPAWSGQPAFQWRVRSFAAPAWFEILAWAGCYWCQFIVNRLYDLKKCGCSIDGYPGYCFIGRVTGYIDSA